MRFNTEMLETESTFVSGKFRWRRWIIAKASLLPSLPLTNPASLLFTRMFLPLAVLTWSKGFGHQPVLPLLWVQAVQQVQDVTSGSPRFLNSSFKDSASSKMSVSLRSYESSGMYSELLSYPPSDIWPVYVYFYSELFIQKLSNNIFQSALYYSIFLL